MKTLPVKFTPPHDTTDGGGLSPDIPNIPKYPMLEVPLRILEEILKPYTTTATTAIMTS